MLNPNQIYTLRQLRAQADSMANLVTHWQSTLAPDDAGEELAEAVEAFQTAAEQFVAYADANLPAPQ